MALVAAQPGSPAYYSYPTQQLKNASDELASSVERIASGNRIIQISDDVAASSIAVHLQSELMGLKQSSSNLAGGSSLLQVAQSALQQISDHLDTLQSVAVQAASDGLTNNQRQFLQQRFNETYAQINTVANATSFNSIKLLDGSLAAGTDISLSQGSIRIAIGDSRTAALFPGGAPDVATRAHATAAQASVTNAQDILGNILGKVTGNQSSFEFAAQSVQRSISGVQSAHSALLDTDFAIESNVLAHDTLKVNSAVAVVAQLQLLQPRLLSLIHR